ncbi:MAG: FHA domain-containing protein, partial [Planctomycetes bacterium]|nr:FHA domain-containing protein [Planctomycetota bacterium]
HLGLVPANVHVAAPAAAQAPVRWQFGVRLGGLGSALPVVLPGGVAGTGFHLGAFYEPGPDVRDDAKNQPFLPMGLRPGGEPPTTVPVACWRTGSPDGLLKFVVEVQAPVGRACRIGDLVVVRPAGAGPALVARIDEVRPRGLLASAMLGPNDPCLQWDGRTLDATLVFHRRFGPAADLAPLGALLVRAVLVDDRQSLGDALAALAKVLRAFVDEPTGVRADVRSAAACMQALLQHKDVRARLDSAHVLHRATDRSEHEQRVATGTPVVPPRLWLPVLTIVARLLSTEAPFAYAGDLADSATVALQNLQADLDAVLQALDVELFFAEARDVAIAAACAEAREELADSGGSVESGPQREVGFRLVLARDGDTRTQELVYHVARVTIGRREGDNLLRLQDPMVSSNHAVIEADGDGFSVSDRNSTNGTEVDGIRLPVDVPQPLVDGSVVRIRPFRLTFHLLTPGSDPTLGAVPLDAEALHDRLSAAHARAHGRPAVAVHEALRDLLRQVRLVVGGKPLLAVLQDARFAPGATASVGTRSTVGAELLAAAQARALQQLARSLVPGSEPTTPELVQQFASRLAKFVEATSQWIERTLELKKVLGKHLEFGLQSTAGGRTPVRSAAEVRSATLGPSPDADPANVARFLDGITDVLAGLLRGNRRVRAAVRERLDPAQLVQATGGNAAATSALWQAYERAFREVTGDGVADAELDALLQRVLPEK